jgi:membrane-associated phospholipid phosphatase
VRDRLTLLLAVALFALVPGLHVWPGEEWGAEFFLERNGSRPRPTWEFFGLLTARSIVVPSVALAAYFAWRAWGARDAAVVLASSVAVLPNSAIKPTFGASDAHLQVNPQPLLEPLNYPSGHAAYAASFFGVLALLAWRHRRWDVALVFAGLTFLMGLARVLGGVHLPVDVLAGWALGAGWMLAVVLVADSVFPTARRAPT